MVKQFEIGENLTWLIIVVVFLIGGVIAEITKPETIITDNNIKEKCVIISIEKENILKGFKNTVKVKFNDGVTEIRKVEDHLAPGDTILVTR